MDNNLLTGNPKVDYFLLALAWLFAFMSWQNVPVILSSVASFCVIVNQIITYRKNTKHKNNYGKRNR
jgi:hypothetical protein